MSVPILSIAEMRSWEAATWEAGIRFKEVIARVGQALAARIQGLTGNADRILILAGRGNNGADARAAVAHLGSRTVDLLEVSDPMQALPAWNAARRRRPDLVVDALFGIGLNRALDPAWCGFIESVNASGVRVLSVDVPSGIDADTGRHWGAVIRADLTVTVGAPKRGLLASEAWSSVGRLEVIRDVGLLGEPAGSDDRNWVLDADFAGWPLRRDVAGNKGDFGRVVVLAGSPGYTGAGILSLRAASRARPGLLAALVPESIHAVVSGQVPSAMVHPFAPSHPLLEKASAILAGPGLADPELPEAWRREVIRLWSEFPGVLVLDASSLAWIADAPVRSAEAGPRVITPHPGEAARMLGVSASEVQSDRPAALRRLATRWNALVILKGHQTLVGEGGGRLWVNSSGNPGLAQGGTGDVLAGFLSGLLAQPALRTRWAEAAAYGVWEHGRTADHLEAERRNWNAEDLADAIGA
ncbi:MAG: NAD(P)H-hydrate dehydratase [Verrucomicrobiales bacterium]|nr:NAD(P)H-hydrate dehydratase [Verrucomicrobiales bacterium]